MKLLAISVGLPQKFEWHNKEVLTSINKTPISGSVLVKKENIEGDQQSDLKVHGGVDKAVYAYAFDTYPSWQKLLGVDSLPFGSLGENLTFDALDESQIFVGDVFEIGTCQIEAVQPRQPCFKLNIKFGRPNMVKVFNDFDRSGVYFRVKKEGIIQAGDSLKLIGQESIKVSIHELFQFTKNRNSISKARAAELSKIPTLTTKWREHLIQHSL